MINCRCLKQTRNYTQFDTTITNTKFGKTNICKGIWCSCCFFFLQKYKLLFVLKNVMKLEWKPNHHIALVNSLNYAKIWQMVGKKKVTNLYFSIKSNCSAYINYEWKKECEMWFSCHCIVFVLKRDDGKYVVAAC